MFGLPDKTYVGTLVPKKKFYENLAIDKKLERSFIDQIVSIRWGHKLSADTLNVEKGSTVEEVEIFHIKLKTRELDLNVLRQMDSQLHYHLIFILEFEEQYQLWTCYKEESAKDAFKVENYYHTDWMTEDTFSLRIDGLNMDTVYENLVRQIAGEALPKKKDDESLRESVERSIRAEELRKQIAAMEHKVRREKQFNKQTGLNTELKKLRQKLEEIV